MDYEIESVNTRGKAKVTWNELVEEDVRNLNVKRKTLWFRVNGEYLQGVLTVMIVDTLKVKACTLDITPLGESSSQKRSGMARVLQGSHSFTRTPTRSSTIGVSHTCLCLPSYISYSFTDPGGMKGWVGLGGWLHNETVYLPEGTHPIIILNLYSAYYSKKRT